jgi:hypothetical protein
VVRTVVVIPLAGLQPAVNGDLLTLSEILSANLCESVPRDNVVL